MPYYRICPYCHAYLDFGERCDRQDEEKAAPSAVNTESGKVDQKLTDPRSTSIIHHNEGGNQA